MWLRSELFVVRLFLTKLGKYIFYGPSWSKRQTGEMLCEPLEEQLRNVTDSPVPPLLTRPLACGVLRSVCFCVCVLMFSPEKWQQAPQPRRNSFYTLCAPGPGGPWHDFMDGVPTSQQGSSCRRQTSKCRNVKTSDEQTEWKMRCAGSVAEFFGVIDFSANLSHSDFVMLLIAAGVHRAVIGTG